MPKKLTFVSSTDVEVEQLAQALVDSGIPCDLRKTECAINGYHTRAELWLGNDRDVERALMVCTHRRFPKN